MKNLLGYEISDEEFDNLFTQQSKGKEIVVENGKLTTREPIVSKEDVCKQEIYLKRARLEELSKDFIQELCGLEIPDIENRKAEFRTLLNEVRVLQGKMPRFLSKG